VCVETGSSYVAQAGLELSILLSQPAKGWDYRQAPTVGFLIISFEKRLLLLLKNKAKNH
jgi:hypothetical protein